MESLGESKKNLWIIVGIIFGALAILSLLVFLIIGNIGGSNGNNDNNSTESVATKEEIEQDLTDIEKGIKQSVADQKAAEAALKDDSKRIRLEE